MRYEYSAQGDLVALIDRAGQVARRFAWRQHMMVSQQFASGLQSHYEWDRLDPLGRVIRQHGNDGEDLRFEYFDTPLELAMQRPVSAVPLAGMAPDGLAPFTVRQVRVIDQLGRLQQFVCNRHYLITCFVDPLGATVRDEWDANRRLKRHTDALGHVTEFEYDGRAQLAAVRNALGQSARFKWHEKFARIRTLTDYDGSEWRYDYDALGTLVQIRGPQGYTESVQVDDRGLPVRRTDARGGQIRLRYNEQALLTEYTDCSGRTTRYDYDREGWLRSVVDALGQRSDYTRDALGRLTALKLPDGAIHRYEYDPADPSGQPAAYLDPLGRPTRYYYNLRGELIERTDAAGGTLEVGYDAAFRRAVLINENLRSYRFRYDDADRLIEERRLDGTRITIEYDAANRPIGVTHYPATDGDHFAKIEREGEARKLANGGEHGYGLGVIAPEADPAAPIRTELIRDALGRLVEKRTPGQHYHYRYDAAGRLVEARKFVVTRSESAEPGQPQQPAQLRLLHTSRFDYDALGNLVAEHASDETTGRTHSLRHEHDLLGNRTQTVLPQIAGTRSRRALNYLHYGSGHLHQINLAQWTEAAEGEAEGEADPREAAHRIIADLERDGLHREIGRSQGGLGTEYALDALGRRIGSWTHTRLADADTYAARIAARAAAAWPAQEGLRKHYQYDLAGELRERAHSQQGATRYDYDPIGRLLGARRSHEHIPAERFAYDPAGNLLDKLPAKGSARGYVRDNLVRVFEDKRYDYDGHGRLTEKRSGKHTLQRFEWDDEHRLIAVHTTRMNPAPKAKRKGGGGAKADTAPPQTTQITTFEYDALGRRIAKVDAFGRTEFIWEGMRLIEERRGSSVVSYVYEPDSYVPLARIDASGNVTDAGGLGTTDDAPLPANDVGHGGEPGEAENARESEIGNNPDVGLEAEPSSNVYYFHTDQVGLPEELTDAQGHIRWRAAYKAWGNTLAERWETIDLQGETVAFVENDEQPAIEQNLRYQGQYLDRDTGLHYNTFRYYDPDVGRFISPDPIGLNGGTNLFAYAPNPSEWVDPWGLATVDATFEMGGRVFTGTNPTERTPRVRGPTVPGMAGPNAQRYDMHAEIEAMTKAHDAGLRGGKGVLTVEGQEVCPYCKRSIKNMAKALGLDEFVVHERASGKTYSFKGSDLNKVREGGKGFKGC